MQVHEWSIKMREKCQFLINSTDFYIRFIQTYRVDINDRLVLLLVGIHPEHILDEFVVCLVEMRGGHDDGGT